MKKVYTLLFDGYADWELGYILPELMRSEKFKIITTSFTSAPVTSMGGLRVNIDTTINCIDYSDIAMLIIPGGHFWEGEFDKELVFNLLKKLNTQQTPIAGICAASTLLPRAGLTNNVKHTGNTVDYLKTFYPEYADEDFYTNELATRDQHIITASGFGAIEFTKLIMDELEAGTEESRTWWFNAFKHGIFNA